MASNWYVVRTMPRAEYIAAGELARDGHEVYLPSVQGPHPRTGHTDAPLFPGYLFIRCDPHSDGWPVFRGIHRVFGWLKLGGEVPALPDDFVASLRGRIEGMNSEGGLWRRFRAGERVQVVSKAMQAEAEIVEEPRSPYSRVKVLMRFMGGLVAGEVPWTDIRPNDDNGNERQRAPRRTRGKGRWIAGFGPRPVPTGT